jgi:hypothetical protein
MQFVDGRIQKDGHFPLDRLFELFIDLSVMFNYNTMHVSVPLVTLLANEEQEQPCQLCDSGVKRSALHPGMGGCV